MVLILLRISRVKVSYMLLFEKVWEREEWG